MVINLFLPILVPTKRTASSWHQHHSSPQKKSDDSLNVSPGNRPHPSDPEPEKEVMEEKKGRGIVTAHCIVHVYLLDISRQLACMKLGRREKYQPIQYCWAGCLGYPVHTCHLPIDIQQMYCSAQTGQHERRTATYIYMYVHTYYTHVLYVYMCICWKLLSNRHV